MGKSSNFSRDASDYHLYVNQYILGHKMNGMMLFLSISGNSDLFRVSKKNIVLVSNTLKLSIVCPSVIQKGSKNISPLSTSIFLKLSQQIAEEGQRRKKCFLFLVMVCSSHQTLQCSVSPVPCSYSTRWPVAPNNQKLPLSLLVALKLVPMLGISLQIASSGTPWGDFVMEHCL